MSDLTYFTQVIVDKYNLITPVGDICPLEICDTDDPDIIETEEVVTLIDDLTLVSSFTDDMVFYSWDKAREFIRINEIPQWLILSVRHREDWCGCVELSPYSMTVNRLGYSVFIPKGVIL